MAVARDRPTEAGQGTVEWVALVSLVSMVLLGVLAVAGRTPPGVGLGRAIADRLLCAARFDGSCGAEPELVAAYGAELAAKVADNAPEIVYEAGMISLPIDFRSCRAARCGNGPDSGPVWVSDTGQPTAAFVHVVDCRT